MPDPVSIRVPERPTVIASYRVKSTPQDVEKLARFIAYEQTVELPERLVKDADVLREVVGGVLAIRPEPGSFVIDIGYNAMLASNQLGQLLNLVYGNVSMLNGIRLVGLQLPPSLLRQFSGPRYGIAGLRELLGVHGRPLLATAIKPRGSTLERLGQIAFEFAFGGGDIVKDDQNLVDADFEAFKRRVDVCATQVARANAITGRNCLYFPHLAAPADQIERYADFVLQLGLKGVLLCPMVLGLDPARMLSEDYGLVFMAHPAMSGGLTQAREHGIAHDILLGSLFRLAGADISVFPATGGRFHYPLDTCMSMAQALKEPLAELAPAFPCPAGGMSFEGLPTLANDYGVDSVFLVGGSLHGHADSIVKGTEEFQRRIASLFPEHRHQAAQPQLEPRRKPVVVKSDEGVQTLLKHFGEYHWQHRTDRVYKGGGELPFAGVRRVELVGKNGEIADFDLRFFELEPGGYTSLEKHLHTHVIIFTHGEGEVRVGGALYQVGANDIAYVPPLQVHQIRNLGASSMGFYCIVDHERDRPMRP